MKRGKMRKIELHALKSDIDELLLLLGFLGTMQIDRSDEGQAPKHRDPRADEWSALRASLADASLFLGTAREAEPDKSMGLPDEDLVAEARALIDRVFALKAETREAEEELDEAREALYEVRAFKGLKLPFASLAHVSYVSLRLGRIDPAAIPELAGRLGGKALILPLDEEGMLLCASSRKGRFALDGELARLGFKESKLPEESDAMPDEVIAALEREEARRAAVLAELEDRRAKLAESMGEAIARAAARFSLGLKVLEIRDGLDQTDRVCRLAGWMLKAEVEGFSRLIEERFGGRVAFRVYEPEELIARGEGRENVPVRLGHGPLLKGFERLVVSYGVPLYGSIDPTPFVAFFFVVLFAIMFGDVGQGFVILLVGFLLGRSTRFARFKHFSPIFIAIGGASMFTGLLYGSFFSNEEILRPIELVLTDFVGPPRDRFIEVLPHAGGVGPLFVFFGFTVAVGVALNSLGLVINIANQFRLGRPTKALFSKTGLAGALFFWYALFFGVKTALGVSPAFYDIIGFALPLLAMIGGEAIFRMIRGGKAIEHGALSFVIEGFVELIETVSYFFSNTMSFLRVGAFALSHAVLSLIVFTLSELVGGSGSLGPALSFLVMLVGNVIILLLEGMIVAIQVVRLQYYEFFSKFFTETGALFTPFSFMSKENRQ